MKNALTLFKFGDLPVRIIESQGEPHFVAMDLADVLGYSDAEALTRRLDEDERQNLQIVGFGPRGVSVLNESGMWSAILGSNKPEAKRFKKWVTAEVLPAIRKTGSYSVKGPDRLTQTLKASDKAAALIGQIRAATDDEARRVLYMGLVECCQTLGTHAPTLESLRPLVPQDPPAVAQFWAVVDALAAVHQVELNHARRAGLVALALKQVSDAAQANGLLIDERVRQVLRHSASRPFVGVRTVNSAITGKSVKCWLFQETPQALLH